MSDYITPILSFIGALLGSGIVLLIYLLEKRGYFRKVTFERRLRVHQQAVAHCYKLQRDLSILTNNDEKIKAIREMELWWEKNCLYLESRSRKSFFSLISEVYENINGEAEKRSTVWKLITQTRNEVVTGIGDEHLPQPIEENKIRNIFGVSSK